MADITTDAAYNTVAPGDFKSMIEVDRYNNRSTAFDKIISATHDHFWDPLDTKYIDFSTPFDIESDYIVDPEMSLDRIIADMAGLDEKKKIKLANMGTLWSLSAILHGEQGALSLSASLVDILKDPGAQEYATNQAREEARHVLGFSRYVQARWGKPCECGPALADLLDELVAAPEVYKKIVGMQMLVEGLAMGAFASLYTYGRDPLLKQLTQLVMTDEAFHHKFGKIWADKTIPHVSEAERNIIEDWAFHCFHQLLFNLVSPDQRGWMYEEVGIDPEWAQNAFIEAMTNEKIREDMQDATNIFRVLIKTLLKAGIITERTAPNYAAFVDMKELHAEGDRMIGDDIAEEGIKYLIELNGGKLSRATGLLAAE